MDSVVAMRAFARVVERGSFSAAADDLGLTPSAVSKLITRLEDRLGVRLLHRTTRRLSLTPEGETYHLRARDILTAIADADAEVSRAGQTPRGACASIASPHSHFTNSCRRSRNSSLVVRK
jgi:DNA-binding transcriptional LysR family regulator